MFRVELSKGGAFLFLVVHRSFKTKRLEGKMVQIPDLDLASITPGQLTSVINFVLVLWGLSLILSRHLSLAATIHRIVVALLLGLVGARFFLLGIKEQDYWEIVLCFPFVIEGYSALESRAGSLIRR